MDDDVCESALHTTGDVLSVVVLLLLFCQFWTTDVSLFMIGVGREDLDDGNKEQLSLVMTVPALFGTCDCTSGTEGGQPRLVLLACGPSSRDRA